MSDTQQRIVVGLGEVLWDVFPTRVEPGGAPANVAFHAGQLGDQGVVVSRVGHDELGDKMIEHLSRQGLDTTYIQRDPEHATGQVTVDVSDPSDPRYTIHEHAAFDYLKTNADLLVMLASASAVCVGTLAQRNAIARQAIHQCLNAAKKAVVVYDVNVRLPWIDRDWVVATLKKTQVLKLNFEEVSIVGQLLFDVALSPREFAKRVRDKFGPWLVCVTRAEAGCRLMDVASGDDVNLPGGEVDLVSAVGAGDAFTAAVIHGLLQDWPLERVGRFANRVGALVAGKAEAMANLAQELTALKAQLCQT